MVHLSKDTKIRELQIRALKIAKRLKYPDEYQATQEAAVFMQNLMSKLPDDPAASGKGGASISE